MSRFCSRFCSARSLASHLLRAFLLAGILAGILPGNALATDTQKQKITDKPPAAAKAPVDPTCKTPGSAAEKTQPDMSSTDPAQASDTAAREADEAAPAEDSMRIKSDLGDNAAANEEAAQESTQPSTKEASSKSPKSSAGPQQCERPEPKRDLTLPSSGKNGSPE